MSRKQFKILYGKMNSNLQFLVDTNGKNSVSGVEVGYILKYQEFRLRNFIESIDKNHEEWLTTQYRNI